METRNKQAMTEADREMIELGRSQLKDITGGTIWVSDGYCVSPWHPPLPLPLLAVAVQNPVELGAIAAGSR